MTPKSHSGWVYLAKCTHDSDIRHWREILLLKEDEHVRGKTVRRSGLCRRAALAIKRILGITTAKEIPIEGHGRRMLHAYERWLGPDTAAVAILRLLGLFDRPARSDLLDELRAKPAIPRLTDAIVDLLDDEWLRTLDQLQQLGLTARDVIKNLGKDASQHVLPEGEQNNSNILDTLRRMFGLGPKLRKAKRVARPVSYVVDTHPLLREHFASELREKQPDAWRAGHRRLYEYLRSSTLDKPQPTIDDLQPLYEAVTHGCFAGRYREVVKTVYWKRISRGQEAYCVKNLGAFTSDLSAVSAFFEIPWQRPAVSLNNLWKSSVLNWAGFDLRALGRLQEARQCMQACLDLEISHKRWDNACVSLGNLIDISLTSGQVPEAVVYAQRAVELASRIPGGVHSEYLAALAHTVFQAGDPLQAERLFQAAENQQKSDHPSFCFVLGMEGFAFCDLLLSKGDYRNVIERCNKTLNWTAQAGLPPLFAALDKISLGRAHLQKAQTEDDAVFTTALQYLGAALDELHKTGIQDYLPLGLLARAAAHRIIGALAEAWHDLTEAQEIAQRSDMQLYLVDVHLEAARLRLAENTEGRNENARFETAKPFRLWSAREQYEAAKRLIEQTGYHRRDLELAQLGKQIGL